MSFTDTYTIPLDNELRNTTGVSEAKVTVEVLGLETRNYKVTNISYINLKEGYTAEIITQSLDVTLRGTPEVLEQIKDENIRAVADLADLSESTGTYMPKVRIYIDGFTDVGALKVNGSDYTVSVEIERG